MIIVLSLGAYYSLSTEIISSGILDKTLIPNLLDCISAYLFGAYYGHFCSRKHKKDDFNSIIIFVVISLLLSPLKQFNGALFHSIIMVMPILFIYLFPFEKLYEKIKDITAHFLCWNHESIDVYVISIGECWEGLWQKTLLYLGCDMEISLHSCLFLCGIAQVGYVTNQFLLHGNEGIAQMRYIRMTANLRNLIAEITIGDGICCLRYSA